MYKGRNNKLPLIAIYFILIYFRDFLQVGLKRFIYFVLFAGDVAILRASDGEHNQIAHIDLMDLRSTRSRFKHVRLNSLK